MTRRTGLALCLAALVMPVAASAATMEGNWMMHKWAATDKCALAAHKAFPDYTPESNAKRDAQYQRCLAQQNLPPRESLDPTPAKP